MITLRTKWCIIAILIHIIFISIQLEATAFMPTPARLLSSNDCQHLVHPTCHVSATTPFLQQRVTIYQRLRPLLNSNSDNEDHGTAEQESKLSATPNDKENNLLIPTSMLSATAILASFGTLWSEHSVILTGCGPRQLPDVIERSCYLCVLVVAGLSVFCRIVTGGSGLATVLVERIHWKERGVAELQMNAVEWLSLFAVMGAFVALGAQTINGEQMDGLSGINEDMCKALQQLD